MELKVHDTIKNQTSKFAIQELDYYLNKLLGMKVIENTEADLTLEVVYQADANDHFTLSLNKGKGKLTANSDVALLIGIYRLFSELGVVYTRPGRENEYLPELSYQTWQNLALELDETASYKHRGVCIEGADSFENVRDFIAWLPKIGMNSFFIQFENPYSFFKRWYEHEFNPYSPKEPFNNEIAQKMSDQIDQELTLRGLVHHRVGHGWSGEVLGYSSKYGWESGLTLPPEKKPYVAQLNGKRELFETAPILTSLDFANPEVGEIMVEKIVDYAKKRPDVDYLHVWLSDARNNICECEKCQQELVADQYIRILNLLDERLSAEGLSTKICFLLYHELLFAPQKEKLKDPKRFTLMFAPITRTFEMSYADVDYEHGIPAPKPYVRNQITLPNSLEENLAYLFEWQKSFAGDSFVYDYPLGRAHYGDLGYMKISRVIYRDIQYLSKLHLNGYISCQELRAGFPHNFPNYVMGQMLWNKEQTYEVLKERYFKALYGEKWASVVAYLEKLSSYSSCDHFNAIGDRADHELAARYAVAANLAEEFVSVIEEALPQVVGMQNQNWRKLAYHREYVVKLADALHLLANGQTRAAQNKWRDVLNFIRNNEQAFQAELDVYRVIEVAKNYAGFKL